MEKSNTGEKGNTEVRREGVVNYKASTVYIISRHLRICTLLYKTEMFQRKNIFNVPGKL